MKKEVFQYDWYSQCMRGNRFEETRPGCDVCLQHYVRADKSETALARACGVCVYPNLGPAESGTTGPDKRGNSCQRFFNTLQDRITLVIYSQRFREPDDLVRVRGLRTGQ